MRASGRGAAMIGSAERRARILWGPQRRQRERLRRLQEKLVALRQLAASEEALAIRVVRVSCYDWRDLQMPDKVSEFRNCPLCQGRGKVPSRLPARTRPCDACGSTSCTPDSCRKCRGAGTFRGVPSTEVIIIHVQVLRLPIAEYLF